MAQSGNGTLQQWHSVAMARCGNDTVWQWHSLAMALDGKGTASQWHSPAMAQRGNGRVKQWHSLAMASDEQRCTWAHDLLKEGGGLFAPPLLGQKKIEHDVKCQKVFFRFFFRII